MERHIVHGIDPGIVHTGLVTFMFDVNENDMRLVNCEPTVFNGVKPDLMLRKIIRIQQLCGDGTPGKVFVEGYKPRSHFSTDVKMTQAISDISKTIRSKVLLNTGVKQIITKEMMQLLGCWKFDEVTHHQDLRSAARIALLGMVKSEEYNSLLFGLLSKLQREKEVRERGGSID